MRRLPLPVRLTVVFVVVMAAVLAVIGGFLYLYTRTNLDNSIASTLRAREGALGDFAAAPPSGSSSLIPAGERYAQLLSLDGDVLEGRPAGEPPMLDPSQVSQASERAGFFQMDESARYFAGPVRVRGRRAVAVAATSLADHERALEGLAAALLVGGPLALLLAGAVAYGVATGALRPIEAMRARAEGITGTEGHRRLPVPDADDEVRRLASTLNDMLARLEQTAEVERRLIANASHEIRTPLAALRTELELARRSGRSAAELRAAIERAEEDVARLTALSSALLDVARQEESGATAGEVVAVEALLLGVASDLTAQAERADRRLVVRPTGVVVRADGSALRRAVTNLADNALVHGRGTVVLGAEGSAADVVIWVEDEGEIDTATAQVAFERFARGPATANRPGAGLGLSLVRTIARQHGGEAGLRAVEGGVRAEIRLPRHEP